MAKIIETKDAPAPIGPYSQAVISNNFLFASGQIAINPKTGEITGKDIAKQTEMVCKNIKAILKVAKIDFKSVIKTTCFLANMADFSGFNEVYAKYFISSPARSCIAAKELPKQVLVEIEIVAEL